MHFLRSLFIYDDDLMIHESTFYPLTSYIYIYILRLEREYIFDFPHTYMHA